MAGQYQSGWRGGPLTDCRSRKRGFTPPGTRSPALVSRPPSEPRRKPEGALPSAAEAMVVRVPLIEGTGGQAGRRHVVALHHTCELPFGAGRSHVSKGIPGKIAGPWDIDGIWVIQSGSPISPPFCRAAFPIPAPMSPVAPATGRTVTRTATFPPARPSTVGLTPRPSALRLPELSATPDRISWLVPASLILTAVSTAKRSTFSTGPISARRTEYSAVPHSAELPLRRMLPEPCSSH